MRIEEITLYRVRLPLTTPYRLSYHVFESFEPYLACDVELLGQSQGDRSDRLRTDIPGHPRSTRQVSSCGGGADRERAALQARGQSGRQRCIRLGPSAPGALR